MKKLAILLMLGSISLAAGATDAATSKTEKAAYESAKKAAGARYSENRKLCYEETSSDARMQCRHDAKSEYDKALADAKKASVSSASAPVAAAVVCADCGKVTAVKVVEKKGEGTPLGMIAGGVAGAVLGHQVGQGRGKDIATIAGAAGGAYAGHKIEENVRSTKSWVVSVHFENGTDRDFSFAAEPGLAAGDAVKLSGNTVVRR